MRKAFAFVMAAVLMLSTSLVVMGAGERSFASKNFYENFDAKLENMVYNGELGKGIDENKVVVDGKELTLDVTPKMVENRILLPLRAIVEALGGEVSWDGKTETAGAKKGDIIITLKINSMVAMVNGVEKELDVPAKLINSRTMVPVRFMSENLGAHVVWDQEKSTAIISSEKPKEPVEDVEQGKDVEQGDDEGAKREELKQQIISKYTSKAYSLRDAGLSRLDGIIAKAKSEYESLPKEKKSSDSKFSIYLKHLPDAVLVEKETKAGFDSLMEQMRQELIKNNLPTDTVDSAKAEYDRQIEDKKNELLNQI